MTPEEEEEALLNSNTQDQPPVLDGDNEEQDIIIDDEEEEEQEEYESHAHYDNYGYEHQDEKEEELGEKVEIPMLTGGEAWDDRELVDAWEIAREEFEVSRQTRDPLFS